MPLIILNDRSGVIQHRDFHEFQDIRNVDLGVWKNWTPVYTDLTVGNGLEVARYALTVNTVDVFYSLTFGSTTTIDAGNPTISMPVPAASHYNSATWIGVGNLLDAGSANRSARVRTQTTTTFSIACEAISGTYLAYVNLTSAIPHTWTTPDEINFIATYERVSGGV